MEKYNLFSIKTNIKDNNEFLEWKIVKRIEIINE
jgi:hypothetical protein